VTRHDFRRRADAVRSIPLETVLTHWGAERDRRDRTQWRTERGPLSVTGAKFFNWHCNEGGGGAIDLVMHLGQMDVRAAVQWLQEHPGSSPAAASCDSPSRYLQRSSSSSSSRRDTQPRSHGLCLPMRNSAQLEQVRRYLTEQRCLTAKTLKPLIDAGKVYADQRGNAVFLMVAGKANRAVGAELRGTAKQVWHGLAPGTCKDHGYFWVGVPGPRKIILCESAIDAISCFQLDSACLCISTAGVRSDAPWLHPLLASGYRIYCGFDNDDPGNSAADAMATQHPAIKRLRPPTHDWNDTLVASR
jgi:hypothetical protein